MLPQGVNKPLVKPKLREKQLERQIQDVGGCLSMWVAYSFSVHGVGSSSRKVCALKVFQLLHQPDTKLLREHREGICVGSCTERGGFVPNQ